MALSLKRFDFGALQDFREPLKSLEIVSDKDVTVEVAEQAPPPPPPTFSEAELEAAKKQAFEEGRRAGLQEGAEKAQTEAVRREEAIQSAVKTIARQIQTCDAHHHEWLRLQSVELPQLVLLVAQQVAGRAISAMPQAGVESLIDECLNVLLHQPKVLLSVHPEIEQQVSVYMQDIIARRGGECMVQLAADESLAIGDARLEWKDGQAGRSIAAIWQQIEQMLQQVDFTALADKAAAMDITDNSNESIKGEE